MNILYINIIIMLMTFLGIMITLRKKWEPMQDWKGSAILWYVFTSIFYPIGLLWIFAEHSHKIFMFFFKERKLTKPK